MKTVSQIAECLAEKSLSLAKYLLPQGKLVEELWVYDSISVKTSGADKGQWTSQTIPQGDLLDLWCTARKMSLSEAIVEAKRWLGIRNETLFSPAPENSFELDISNYSPLKNDSHLADKLCKQFQLSFDTLHQFKLHERQDWLFFPYFKKANIKQFKAIKDDKSKYAINKQTTLFGWQALPAQARTVVLTLNEIDTMTLHQYGIPSLAIPMMEDIKQSLAWLADEFESLYFDKIYFAWHENNTTKAFTHVLRERLGRFRCYQLQLPYESVNQCLQARISAHEIQTYLDKAKTSDPEELRSALDFTDDILKLIHQDTILNTYQSPWNKCDERISFRPNELSIWTGINGHGKSQLLGYLMLHFMQQGARICIASLELKPERVLLRLNRQLLASNQLNNETIHQAQDWYLDRLWLFNLVGSTKTERLLSVFEYARQRYGIDIFVIDSIMKCGINEDDYNTQKHFVEQLCDFKNEHPVHIHLVAHPRKSQDENHLPNKMDIKGTGSMTDLADNVFTVWRNKNKEAQEADAVLQCDKQRNGEWEGKIKLWFDLTSCHYLETEEAKAKPLLKPQFKSVETTVESDSTLNSTLFTALKND